MENTVGSAKPSRKEAMKLLCLTLIYGTLRHMKIRRGSNLQIFFSNIWEANI